MQIVTKFEWLLHVWNLYLDHCCHCVVIDWVLVLWRCESIEHVLSSHLILFYQTFFINFICLTYGQYQWPHVCHMLAYFWKDHRGEFRRRKFSTVLHASVLNISCIPFEIDKLFQFYKLLLVAFYRLDILIFSVAQNVDVYFVYFDWAIVQF